MILFIPARQRRSENGRTVPYSSQFIAQTLFDICYIVTTAAASNNYLECEIYTYALYFYASHITISSRLLLLFPWRL